MQTLNVTLSEEESEAIGLAVIAELDKFSEQPVLYLMDLVDADIPSARQGMRDAYQSLMADCRGIRCPSCSEDSNCLPRPYDKPL